MRKSTPFWLSLVLTVCLSGLTACGNADKDYDLSGESGDAESTTSDVSSNPTAEVAASSSGTSSGTSTANPLGRMWTVAEILSEDRTGGSGGEPLCGGEGGFRRCLCPENVPSAIRYRPAVAECNGNAAAILYDQYVDAFSVVVRDTQNRDRWPAAGSGFGGCSASVADSDSPPNSCSAFKVQDKFKIGDGTAMVHCFGASGYSELFADAARLTVKLEDVPNASSDPLERFCLRSGDLPLN